MKAISLGLSLAALIATASGEIVDTPMKARSRALVEHGDVLYVYTTEKASPEVKQFVQGLREQGGIQATTERPILTCIVDLPTRGVKPGMAVEYNTVVQAARHGVSSVPTFVLCDRMNKPYFSHTGLPADLAERNELMQQLEGAVQQWDDFDQTIKALTDEVKKGPVTEAQVDAILQALKDVPAESWGESYPELVKALDSAGSQDPQFLLSKKFESVARVEKKFSELLTMANRATDKKACLEALAQMEEFAESDELDVHTRQCVLLTGLYPLLVKAQQVSWDGVNTPENERFFNLSIETLEKARDLDKNSYWGREAHRLREELRRERLNAAKFD
jgi:hypothetical protein